ncbi:MAG: hypothetical protein WC686_00860 [Candidatus Shapirobacteria bacterium]|jgi:hypothetical protein
MKIYFVASPRVVFEKPEMFRKIHHHLAKDNKMLSDGLLRWTDPKGGFKKASDVLTVSHEEMVKKVDAALDMVRKADVIIMEISGHSMSMGYLTAKALEISKPVIYLQMENSDLHWMDGLEHPKLRSFKYDENNVLEVLDQALESAQDLVDVRFNFFVNPKILAYLDWVAKNRMQPRSVFLRNLIEKQMRKEREFKK